LIRLAPVILGDKMSSIGRAGRGSASGFCPHRAPQKEGGGVRRLSPIPRNDYFRYLKVCGFRKRTPSPPPLSSMKSIPVFRAKGYSGHEAEAQKIIERDGRLRDP
jgi:hypothetical protein